MKYTCHQVETEGGLSEEQKRVWDKIINDLAKYFQTSEGEDFYERFVELMSRVKDQSVASSLSETENRALVFIHKEYARGCSPSVRKVATAVGYRSSRSGHRVMSKLKAKGLL